LATVSTLPTLVSGLWELLSSTLATVLVMAGALLALVSGP
jgi:hypothetical protein